MKKILLALFLAASTLTFSFAVIGDNAPVLTSEEGDSETDSDQSICYDLRKNLGPVNTGTYRNADRYTNGEVTKLQQFLHDDGFLIPTATGFFGAKTKAAVMSYQRSKGFDVISGYVGPMTRAAIKADTCGGSTSDNPIMCTMEARMCEDGSVMPRGPGCGWHPEKCPGVTEINPNNVSSPLSVVGNAMIRGDALLRGSSTCVVPTYVSGGITNNAQAAGGTCAIEVAWPTITESLASKVIRWQYQNGTNYFGNTYLTDIPSKSKLFTVGKTNIVVEIYSQGVLYATKTLSAVCATGAARDTNGRCVVSSVVNNQTTNGATCGVIAGYVWNNGSCVQNSTVNNNGVVVSGSPTFNFTTANYTVPAGTQIRLNWYQIVGATSCVASGGWSGTKNITGTAMNGADGSSELVTVTAPTTYTLTCSGGGLNATKSITVNIQSSTAAAGTPELILTINGSKGPIDAVANRFGSNGTTALNASWTSNVDVTNCGLGAGFTQYQSSPTLTQTTSKSGTIQGAVAQRTWVSTAPQNFDYTMACKRISASGYSETLQSNTVRVDVCDVGFHIVRDGSFNGGTCVADAQASPTCSATQTLTNGVCVDNTLSGTPAVNLSVDSSSCVIATNQSTCRVSLTANVAGISTLRYFTRVNGVVTTPVTMTLSPSSVLPLDITHGTTDVVFNGYYGGGSTNIQANKVLTATCATGSSWNGSVCAAGGTVSTTPSVPSIAVSASSVTMSQAFSLHITDNINLANSGTSYNIRISGTTAPTLYTTGASKNFNVTPSTSVLPFVAGNSYTFQVQACIASVCSAWSESSSSVSIASTASTAITPTLWLYANGATVANGATITAINGVSSLSWQSANAASCTLKQGSSAEASIPTAGGPVDSAILPAGSYPYIYKCINSSGGQASISFTFVVPVSITANKTSISSIESVLISWSGVGATKYRLTVDGTELPNDVTETSWSGPLGFPTPPGLGLSAGTHTFKVKAYNGSTFVGESNTLSVLLRSTSY